MLLQLLEQPVDIGFGGVPGAHPSDLAGDVIPRIEVEAIL
jgi:hypothetical protein